MIRLNLKIIIICTLITAAIVWGIGTITARLIKAHAEADLFTTLRVIVAERVRYDENGNADLEKLIYQTGIRVYCESANQGEVIRDEGTSDCAAGGRYFQYRDYGRFTSRQDGLISISVWDKSGDLVEVIPESETTFLQSITNKGATLDWSYNRSGDHIIPDIYVYRMEPWNSFPNPDNNPIIYGVPIYNASKTDTLGYVLLHVDPISAGAGFLIEPMLLFVIPLTILLSSLGAIALSRGMKRRVVAMQQITGNWATGDFSPKIPITSGDILGQMGENLNQMAGQLEDLIAAKSLLATFETRQKLARDLHDAAKQQLFAATMQLSAADALIESSPSNARQHLNSATDLTKQAQDELSAVINELRPVQLQSQNLITAIEKVLDSVREQQNLSVNFASTIDHPIHSEIESGLFRILQEALNNVVKHSDATQADIHLSSDESQILLSIKDNGRGFNTQQHSAGFGLQSMRERANEFGALLTIKSETGNGTTISVQVDHNQTSV